MAKAKPAKKASATKKKPAKTKPAAKAKAKAKPAKAKGTWANWVPPPSLAKPGVYEKIQAFCLRLPGVTERASHGAPCFFVGSKQFAILSDNHHHDGRFAILVAAPPGAQAMLVEDDPENFYLPAYVRWQGWVGIRLDRKVPWTAVTVMIEMAYVDRASPKLAAEFHARG